MTIEMKKFGTILNSRPDGREAAFRLFQIVGSADEAIVVVDFNGVEILTPSFADEFLRTVYEKYSGQKEVKIVGADTPVVRSSLEVMKDLSQ